MKILIADDDSTTRLILTATLQHLQHDVTAVETGLQAWDAFRKAYFQVLITDWQMPEIEGMVLTQLVRSARIHEHYTYVIMLTAHGGKENYLEGIKAGADDFVVKPFDEDYLEARLHVAERIVGLNNHVRRLETILSICSYCKRVRGPDGQWMDLEQYVHTHLQPQPSHTVCPQCYASKVKPELDRLGVKTDDLQI